jgi:hypothetical protein
MVLYTIICNQAKFFTKNRSNSIMFPSMFNLCLFESGSCVTRHRSFNLCDILNTIEKVKWKNTMDFSSHIIWLLPQSIGNPRGGEWDMVGTICIVQYNPFTPNTKILLKIHSGTTLYIDCPVGFSSLTFFMYSILCYTFTLTVLKGFNEILILMT